jgi:cyclase
MLKRRLIAVLICRDGRIVQSVKFKHTNVIHYDPVHAMEAFNKWSVDEIILLNVTRDPVSKEKYIDIVRRLSKHCFVPLTVGGWITDDEYAHKLLRNGADKLVINTILSTDEKLVKRLSKKYGKQCIVASIDFKINQSGSPEVMIDRGRKTIGLSPDKWAIRVVELGAGELLLNSIDHDGARKGYDLKMLKLVSNSVNVPIIAFGGVFTWAHLVDGINAGADAVAVANQFHYTEQATRKAKSYLNEMGIPVRRDGQKLA